MNPAREAILGSVRSALKRQGGAPPAPPKVAVASRAAGDPASELELLLAEISKISGVTRRLAGPDDLDAALANLVQVEQVQRATLWPTAELSELGLFERLQALGVEIISPFADYHALASCDLGITGVDAALPETGTLVLRGTPEQPRAVSLLPRVHLALLRPAALRADLDAVFAEVKHDNYAVFITGPSRTADIELTLTIGVHGPKALYVWSMES